MIKEVGVEARRNPPDSAAVEAGAQAFRDIAGAMSDHLTYGKSRPQDPRCPYRIESKVQAWQLGYQRARDEFFNDWDE